MVKNIIDECISRNEILTENDLHRILGVFISSLRLDEKIKDNRFTSNMGECSTYLSDNSIISFDLQQIIDKSIRYAGVFRLNDLHDISLINLFIIRTVIYQLYMIKGYEEYSNLIQETKEARKHLIEEGLYNNQMKFYDPFERYANIHSASYIGDLLIEDEIEDLRNVFLYEVVDRRCIGYDDKWYYFPMNKFFSKADMPMPNVNNINDKTLVGLLADTSELEYLQQERKRLLNRIM